MTDKQIIDITQCPFYREGKVCTYLSYESKCEGDCLWTEYKEKESQIELLEEENDELNEIIDQLKEDYKQAGENWEHLCKIKDESILKIKEEKNEYIDKFFLISQKYSKLEKLIKELRLVGQESMRAGRMIAGAWLMCKIDEVLDGNYIH